LISGFAGAITTDPFAFRLGLENLTLLKGLRNSAETYILLTGKNEKS